MCILVIIDIKNEESRGWDELERVGTLIFHTRPFSDSHKTAGFHTQQHR